MTVSKKFFLIVLSFVLTLGFTACNNGGDDPIPQTLEGDLAGTWVIESVTVNGVDANINTSGFSLTLNVDNNNESTTYSMTFGALPPFAPNSGTWNATTSGVTFSGSGDFSDFNVSFTTVSEERLVFEFTDPNDKTAPVYEVTLVKQ